MALPQTGIYRKLGTWELLGGIPNRYLIALQKAVNDDSPYGPERVPKPPGKHGFDLFVAREGGRAPNTIGLVEGDHVAVGAAQSRQPLGPFLRALPDGHYFCKPNSGRQGAGALHVELHSGSVRINDEERDLAFLEMVLSANSYLIQEWLVPRQHELMARFNPAVINSIRLTTFDSEPRPTVVCGLFRAAITSSAVDNFSAGGVAVQIDVARGTIVGGGLAKELNGYLPAHPVSAVRFDGQPIPYFREAVRLVEELHARLRAKTLGWDLALLEDGPTILECNRNGWDIAVSAIFEPDFLDKFLDFHLPAHEMSLSFEFTGDFSDRDQTREFLSKALGKGRVSGRLDDFSPRRLNVTGAGSQHLLKNFIAVLRSPAFSRRFGRVRWARSDEQIRRGLDLSASFTAE
jgi:hypothetical protein